MRKIILVLLSIIYISNITLAQDRITKNSGEAIDGKILEINPDAIKIKKGNNKSDSTLIISKLDIESVQYENGTKYKLNLEGNGRHISSTMNKKFSVEVAPVALIPTGTLAVDYNVGIGIETTVLCELSQNTSLFGQTGMDYIRGPQFFGHGNEIGHNSILFGIRYSSTHFYFGFGAGLGSYFTHYNGQHGFEINPQIGYLMKRVNFQLKFNRTTLEGLNYTFLNIGLAFKFCDLR